MAVKLVLKVKLSISNNISLTDEHNTYFPSLAVILATEASTVRLATHAKLELLVCLQ